MLKFLIGFMVAISIPILSGCGGGSSGGGGGQGGQNNGNCVSVARHSVGQTLRYKNTPSANASSSTFQEWTILEFGNTSSSTEIVLTGGSLNGVINETRTYSISNNYMDITKYIQQSTINSNSVATTIEFSPFQRTEIDSVCRDQTWTSSFKLSASTSTANGASYPSITKDMTSHYTIESINETKSVAAGTFNTYRKKMIDGQGATVIWWIDTKTGAMVYVESYDSAGALNSTMELLSIE